MVFRNFRAARAFFVWSNLSNCVMWLRAINLSLVGRFFFARVDERLRYWPFWVSWRNECWMLHGIYSYQHRSDDSGQSPYPTTVLTQQQHNAKLFIWHNFFFVNYVLCSIAIIFILCESSHSQHKSLCRILLAVVSSLLAAANLNLHAPSLWITHYIIVIIIVMVVCGGDGRSGKW